MKFDLAFLEEKFYYFKFNDHPNKVYSVCLSNLNKKEVLEDFIGLYGDKIKAKNSDVVATYFCSTYGWILAGLQYALSIHHTTFTISLTNIELQLYYDEKRDYYGVCFRLINSTKTNVLNDALSRQVELEKLYSSNVVPLIDWLHTSTNVRKQDLYGQLAVGLYYGFDVIEREVTTKKEKAVAQADFNFITKEIPAATFHLKKNPFDIDFRMIESPREKGVMLRMKPSCCLYYQTEGASYKCYGCPRMSEKERAERRKEILASL